MKISLLLICALVLFNSCGKDDKPAIATGTFESAAMVYNEPLVLYTKGHAITDTVFIRAFHERNFLDGVFNLTPGMAPSPYHVSLDNRVADSVYFNAVGLELVFNQVYYEGNTAVYIGRDSLPAPAVNDGELSCNNVGQYLRRHPLQADCVPTLPSGNWVCKAQARLPLVMNGNDISLPVISYYFMNKTSSISASCIIQDPYVFDQFNEEALKTIHEEDTLLVQRRMLVLERR